MPGQPPRAHRARYRRILSFASRILVQTWWYELVLPRIGFGRVAERTRERRVRNSARRFHTLATELGGLMIKVGQFLSSRLDVFPPEVTAELEGLQDEVPAVSFADIKEVAERELGMSLERAYEWFSEEPVAAASLGQAHRARLRTQNAEDVGFVDVIVKVQRPGIDEIVAVDLSALRRVARWLEKVDYIATRMDAPGLVEEFAKTSMEEIDYLREASHAERFAELFAEDERIRVPGIAWERTTGRLLTLSDVTAIKLTDHEALARAGINPSEVAQVFAEVMLDQVFTHSFFHADPHPGNLFVAPVADGWRLTFIDFGMMGEVSSNIRDGLRTLVIAVAARDSRGLVDAARSIGVLLPNADGAELERALTALFARFGGMGFAELRNVDPSEFTDFVDEFSDLMREMPFQLPENLLLLFRAMSLTSGVCSGLDPTFNIWDAVEPYASRMLRNQSAGLVADYAKQAVSSAGILWRLPQRVDSLITRMDQGTVTFDTSRMEKRLDRIERLGRRLLAVVLFGCLLVGGALVLPQNEVLGNGLMLSSVAPLLFALAGIFRR